MAKTSGMTGHRASLAVAAALTLALTGCHMHADLRSAPASHSAPTTTPTPLAPLCTPAPAPAAPSGSLVLRGCLASVQPVSGQAVVVVQHQPGLGESLADTFNSAATVLLSGGLACESGNACSGTDYPKQSVPVDANGRFTVVLPAGSPAAGKGTDTLTVLLPGGEAVATTSVEVRTGGRRDLVVPPIEAWRPHARISLHGAQGLLRYSPLPVTVTASYTVTVTDRYDQRYVIPVAGDGTFDAHVLAPGLHGISLSYETRNVAYRSQDLTVRLPWRPIATREACHLVTPTGKSIPTTELDGCRLGDGDWTSGGFDDYYPCDIPDAQYSSNPNRCLGPRWTVVVDLHHTTAVSDLVLAGLSANPHLSVSVDGRTWRDVTVGDGSGGSVVATGPLPVTHIRYVRLSQDNLAALSEVVVFS